MSFFLASITKHQLVHVGRPPTQRTEQSSRTGAGVHARSILPSMNSTPCCQLWLGGQVARRRSRKPKIPGSIPGRASVLPAELSTEHSQRTLSKKSLYWGTFYYVELLLFQHEMEFASDFLSWSLEHTNNSEARIRCLWPHITSEWMNWHYWQTQGSDSLLGPTVLLSQDGRAV